MGTYIKSSIKYTAKNIENLLFFLLSYIHFITAVGITDELIDINLFCSHQSSTYTFMYCFIN